MSGGPRRLLERFTLDPATGIGVPVRRGQVLTVTQIGNGQCLDFNAYALGDYKEQFHSGRTRGLHGLHPSTGDHLWSAPPRERIMFTIVEDTVGTNDLTYSRCSGFLYEAHYGFSGADVHSNCHDIFSEAIREWGLTPDDVHDSFNGFMNTRIVGGRLAIGRMRAKPGDRLSFLAQIDALAVAVCCGGDLGATNNYELKGLEISVHEASASDRALLVDTRFDNQRSPAQFRLARIKADRALEREAGFAPEWPWRERIAQRHPVAVHLDPTERTLLERIRATPEFSDMDEADLLRFIFFQWLERDHRKPIRRALEERRGRPHPSD